MSKELDILEEFIKKKIKEKKNIFFPKHSRYRYIVLILNILHLLLACVHPLLFFLPPSFQIVCIIYYSLLIFHWYIFDGHCILTLITNWVGGLDDNDENNNLFLIPELSYSISSIALIISTFFYLYPKYSLFHFLSKFDIKK